MGDGKAIDELIRAAVESIRQIVDVDTIIGKPINTPDGFVIIPVSRISVGFGAGGVEGGSDPNKTVNTPYGGGTGAGVSVSPVGFLVAGNGEVKLLTLENSSPIERLIEAAPQAVDYLKQFIGRKSADAKADI